MEAEQRDGPRYRVFLQIHVDGIEMTANNISSQGMQFSCPEFLIGRLEDTLNQESYDLDMQLPMVSSPCRASVKTMYNSTYGDEHLIGVKYVNLEGEHADHLSQYLQGLADKNAPLVE